MKDEKKIKDEATAIIKELLRINNEKILINKYMHELVFEMVENKNDYHDVLYEVVNMIPIDLYITNEPFFKFDTFEEYMNKHTKYYQQTIYDK